MTEYKAAKEAFVAGNPGSSIWSINAVSLVGLTAYALYAALISQSRKGPLFDYATAVLPLLVGVTTAATWPVLYTAVLLIPVAAAIAYNPSRLVRKTPAQPSGTWLDESDSEEEDAKQAEPSDESGRPTTTVQLPSQIMAEEMAAGEAQTQHDEAKPNGNGLRSRRPAHMRHNPTPSTHTHTSIAILATPESPKTASFTSATEMYPSMNKLKSSEKSNSSASVAKAEKPGQLAFLSVYRAHMMIMTIHCILAVDFSVFPRWQAKCEDFGTSLMDVGVGSFVFSLGLVSVRAFPALPRSSRSKSASKTGPTGKPLAQSLLSSLRKSIPVLALGFVRVMLVKGTDYPEHVTEYGVHWNFFFTLGLLPFLDQLVWPLRRSGPAWSVLGLALSAVHQTLLSTTSLQAFTLSSVRNGLISANKEGLVSLPGYLAIYFIGLATGEHVLGAAAPSKVKRGVSEGEEEHAIRHVKRKRSQLSMELVGYAVGWWSLLGLCSLAGPQANLPYVLWTAAFNTAFLLGYLTIERLFFPPDRPNLLPACPPLLDAINANGLVVFLVANLLTGAVNVSMESMYAGDAKAMAVLVLYSVGVCSVTWFARGKRLKL